MRLGIVGTGMIVNFVAPHFAEWGLDTAAVCGTPSTADQVQSFADMLGAAPYTDYDQMLAEANIDTVYVAVPNFLHHSFSKKALLSGRNVIVEKPIASNFAEAEDLAITAREGGLLLYEAISTLHLPNYSKIRELLPMIGDVRVVSCNYSQYSSRYDAFRTGQVLPAFDPEKSGGALMDLGLYDFHYVVGLFGEPLSMRYEANVERGIDTSGVTTMDYGTFKAVCVAAKDCAAPTCCQIQGTKGYLIQTTPPNNCGAVTLHLNDGTEETFSLNPELQWESEFRAYARGIAEGDAEGCYALLDHSLLVSRLMTEARLSAGVVFPADRN